MITHPPKYKTGDVLWRVGKPAALWPTRIEGAYEVVVVTSFFDKEVSQDVHYVHKVYTHIDHYFEIINEKHLFPTKEAAEKDSERRYHVHKRHMSEIKKQGELLIQAAAKKRVDKQ